MERLSSGPPCENLERLESFSVSEGAAFEHRTVRMTQSSARRPGTSRQDCIRTFRT